MKRFMLAMFLAVSCAALVQPAEAGKKRRNDFTAEQQKKIFEEGLKRCKQKLGFGGNVRVDYAHNRYLCYLR